jgi:hypothetical protein
MAAMKTMTCIVLDVGASMGQNIEDSLLFSKLDVSLAFIGSQITQKMMASKTAEFGLYTYGDSITNNYLNTSQGEGQYEHVNEVFSISRSGPLALEAIRSVKASSLVGDMIDGIVVGQDSLVRTNAKYKFNRVMLFITDGETEVSGVEDLEQIVASMRINNCPIYVGLMGKVTRTSSPVKRGNAELLKDIAQVLISFSV